MKRDVRQAIIEAGADLVHRQGFHRTGLKDILEAAGVPKGSFYFYFRSKDDFGLAMIEHHARRMSGVARDLLFASCLPPLERLARFFALLRGKFEEAGCLCGCPIGNLAQEMSDLSPAMREAISRCFAGLARMLAGVLEEAVGRGELPRDLDPEQTAAFLVDAWEGAILRMKAEKSVEPLRRFEQYALARVLR